MSLADCIKTAGNEINAADAEFLIKAVEEGYSESEALDLLIKNIDKEQADLAAEIGEENVTTSPTEEGLQDRGSVSGREVGMDTPIRPSPSEDKQAQRQEDGSLLGLPQNIEGFDPKHNPEVEAVAQAYMAARGLEYNPPSTYQPVDVDRAERIAQAYDEMEHNPNDPEVKAAYAAMIDEVTMQYQFMVDAGYTVEFMDLSVMDDPYAANPRMVNDDIADNKHMWVFPTREGFGSDETVDVSDNPLLAETDFIISGERALVNDLFRAVHDFYGHAKEGLGTRAGGEENAWRMHASMFSPLARRAATSETRGQNSWLNFGPHAETNQTANIEDTVFADQKTGIMPEWTSIEGAGDPQVNDLPAGVNIEFAPNPDSKVLKYAFNFLSQDAKRDLTAELADRHIPALMAELGIEDYSVEYTEGGYEADISPSLIINMPNSSMEEIAEVGKILGWVADQKEIVAYDERSTGTDNDVMFVKIEPRVEMGYDAQEELYTALHGYDAELINGYTWRDGGMLIANFTGKSDDDFLVAINEAIAEVGGVYDISHSTFESKLEDSTNLEGTRYDSRNSEEAGEGREHTGREGNSLSKLKETQQAIREEIRSYVNSYQDENQAGKITILDSKGPENKNKFTLAPSLRVSVKAKPTRGKPLFLNKTNNKNAQAQLDAITPLLEAHPDAHINADEWSKLMVEAFGSNDIPLPPARLLSELANGKAAEKLAGLTDGQIEDANHGFENASEFRRAYTSGELDVGTTGKLLLWSFLSRGVSPYAQESLFIDSFNGIEAHLKAAAAGNFDLDAYLNWTKTIAPKGSGQSGAGAAHNLNAFGRDFLVKMSEDSGDGRSKLQVLHDMFESGDMSGKEIRREFVKFSEGVGIDNKVISFTLLVIGYDDVMVLDRVQIRQLWDDGTFAGVNLYDGQRGPDGKEITGTKLALLVNGARGIFLYEAIEKAIEARVGDIYTAIGRPEHASIGRYHWETWVADSQQEASHATLGAILADASGNDSAIHEVTAKQGEYGAYQYGARYGVSGEGASYYDYQTPDGKVWTFTVPEFVQFQAEIKKPKNGVVPKKFKVSESGNGPWYIREGVNQESLSELAREISSGEKGQRAGTFLQDGKSVSISNRYPANLYQQNRGWYNPERTVIRLTNASNASTFIHEFGHFMLDSELRFGGENLAEIKEWLYKNIDDIAAEAGVPASEVANFIEGYTRSGQTISAAERAVHEYFARGFEAYLMEGKAQSKGLRGVFRQFANWLTRTYQDIKFDMPNLDDNMREVFDRMLLSEKQVEEAEVVERYLPLFKTAEEAGMTTLQWAAYQNGEPSEVAVETLREQLLKEVSARREKAWKKERDVEAQVQREIVATEQVYEAMTNLKGKHKLSRILLKDIVGKIPPQLRGMSSETGGLLSPDDAAALNGYGSGDEMIAAILEATPINDEAQARADAVMLQRHGDILNDGSLELYVDEAVKNEERGLMILTELKALRRGKPAIDRGAMKEAAQQTVNGMTRRQLKPHSYRQAEIRAAKASATAFAKGDTETAAKQKEIQAANFYLWREAMEARKEFDKIEKMGTRFKKKPMLKAIGKAGNGYLEQYNNLLARFGMAEPIAGVQGVEEWHDERVFNQGDGLVFSPEMFDTNIGGNLKDIKMATLRGLKDALDSIEHAARYETKIRAAEQNISLEEGVSEAVASIYRNNKVKYKVPQHTDSVEGKTIGSKWRTAVAELTKIGWMQSWLDGGERVGINHQLVLQPITDGMGLKAKLFDEVVNPVTEAIKNFSKETVRRHNTKLFIPELKSAEGAEVYNDGNIYGSQLLAIMLNTGNQGNLEKMIKGEGWGDDYTINNPVIQAVMARVTKEDMDFVQLVWNQMQALQKPLFDVQRRVTGLQPKPVKATQVVTPYGTYKGGYYPMAYDYNRSVRGADFQEQADKMADSAFGSNDSMNTSVSTGAVHERTGFSAPIRLNIDVVSRHFDETVHFISLREAVRDVGRVTKHPTYAKAVIETMGKEHYDLYRSWLDDVARDGRSNQNLTTLDSTVKYLQGGLTLAIMGFKASTGLIQISGLSSAAAEVGAGNVLSSMRSILFSSTTMKDSWTFATENSKIMKHRIETMDREIKNAIAKFGSKNTFMDKLRKASMMHIAYVQTYLVDLPSWHAAYAKELRSSNDEKLAAQYADFVVEQIQGSGATKDMAKLFRNQSAMTHTLTMFMTFFSSLTMTQRDLVRGAQSGNYDPITVASKFMFMIAIPVAFEMMMRGELGDDEPEDEAVELANKIASFSIGGVPIVRDVVSYLTTDFGYSFSPLSQWLGYTVPSASKGLEAMMNGEQPTESEVRAMVKAGMLAANVPASSQLTTIMKAYNEGGSLWEFVMGVKND